MKLTAPWFYSDDQAWSPSLYEWWFSRTRIGARYRAQEEQAVVRAVERRFASAQRVLEVGSGTGYYTRLLEDRGATVVARDASTAMVDYLRALFLREGRPTCVEMGRLPDDLAVTGTFDGVVAIGVLNYVDDLPASLATIADLLEPDGWLVFSVPPADSAGNRYRFQERLGRRRVFLRSAEDVAAAAMAAGVVIETSDVAGVMAVYQGVKKPGS